MALADRTVIVSGAAQGIGRGVAVAFAKAGAAVALLDLNEADPAATSEEIADAGGRSISIGCDVSDRLQVRSAVQRTAEELAAATVLVNNAMGVRHAPVEEITDSGLALHIGAGILGPLYSMQECFPHMRAARFGRIFNFGFGAATMGMENMGAYALAKEGVRGLTKVASAEWGKYGITVNTLAPSVRTSMFESWLEELTPEQRAQQLDLVPTRRFGDAETDIGAVAVSLSGEGGSFITGRTLHIDGGRAFYDK